jgi:predicted nucleic acid-binding protein
MLIESDLLIPVIKREDRLRDLSDRVLTRIKSGNLMGVYASTAAMQEVIFWLNNRGVHSELVRTIHDLKLIPNLEWVPISPQICLEAALLIREYGLGPFDAYHAATALSRDSEILSTEHIYGKVSGLSVLDPNDM